ncbi:MAG: hypothetical protein N2Z72_06675 [Bacteroidales bacterium]|nr:hypothetical protein [Bacteroidales bacterium]
MNIGSRCFRVVLLCSLFFSCKKNDEQISITGQVREKHTGKPIEQVKVTIWANGFIQGVYQANYAFLNSTYSLSDGTFAIEIEEGKYDNLKIEFFKSGFYREYSIFNATQVSNNSLSFTKDMEQIMNVYVQVKNVQPVDDSDKITIMFDKLRSEANCCGNQSYQFFGKTIDTIIHCLSVRYVPVIIHKVVEKNQQMFVSVDSILSVAKDTVWWTILY